MESGRFQLVAGKIIHQIIRQFLHLFNKWTYTIHRFTACCRW